MIIEIKNFTFFGEDKIKTVEKLISLLELNGVVILHMTASTSLSNDLGLLMCYFDYDYDMNITNTRIDKEYRIKVILRVKE